MGRIKINDRFEIQRDVMVRPDTVCFVCLKRDSANEDQGGNT